MSKKREPRIQSRSVAHLRLGDIIDLGNGKTGEIVLVNESRAKVHPLYKEQAAVTDRFSGTVNTFSTSPDDFNISPNSEVQVLSRARVCRKPGQ